MLSHIKTLVFEPNVNLAEAFWPWLVFLSEIKEQSLLSHVWSRSWSVRGYF